MPENDSDFIYRIKIIMSVFIGMIIAFSSGAQTGNGSTWFSFMNNDSTLLGFKDEHGRITVEPVSHTFAYVNKFDVIVPIVEESGGYYLMKDGRTAGFDSLYIFDMATDCESEGFIRFRDSKTDKVGMFDGNGNIVIPAIYNVLTKVTNGLVVALRNAEKEYWDDEDDHSGCNHYSWRGGEILLIDTNNRILLNNFDYSEDLNFYSMDAEARPEIGACREYFQTTAGTYYSFVSFEKEFRMWLFNLLSNDLVEETIRKICYDQIIRYDHKKGYVKESKFDFTHKDCEQLRRILSGIKNSEIEYTIEKESLSIYIFDPKEYEPFYDNCDRPNEQKYPVFEVTLQNTDIYEARSDRLFFLRTDAGYKLIGLSVTSESYDKLF